MAAAANAFRKELESNPNDFVSNLQMGVLFKQDQRYDEARSSFDRALARPSRRPRGALPARHPGPDGREHRTGACSKLEELIKETPHFVEAHVSLATVYYRLKRKADGDRERAIVPEAECGKSGDPTRGQGAMRLAAWLVTLALPLLATAAPPLAGDQVCAGCHRKEAARFRETPMAQGARDGPPGFRNPRRHPVAQLSGKRLPVAHRARAANAAS